MNQASLPGQDSQPQDVTCVECGHFVGALTRCPKCGAPVHKRMSLRALRYAAVLLATVGLGLLYLMVTHREIPLVKIGELKPTMNFAYVRIAGTVSSDARAFREGGKIRSMRFMVDDGSGEISVTAFRAQAQALADADKIPNAGDRIEVAGSLSVTADDDVVMRLQVPEQLTLTRAEAAVTPLEEITGAMVGSSAVIKGTITAVSAPKPQTKQPWVVKISDGTAEKEITFWDDIYAEIPDKVLLMKGTPVRARVSVKTYRDQLQLSLGRANDLEFLGTKQGSSMTAGPAAPTVKAAEAAIADITAEMAGQVVRVTGRVAEVNPPKEEKAPHEVILEDGGSKIRVVYWDTVASRLKGNKPMVGALISVRGMVGVYEGQLQLKVNHSDQISLVDVLPEAKAKPVGGTASIADIKKSDEGKVFTLRGKLGEPKSVRGGVIYPLTEGKASISMVLWDRSVPGDARDQLTSGCTVIVSGEIKVFKDVLEIVPANPQALQMVP